MTRFFHALKHLFIDYRHRVGENKETKPKYEVPHLLEHLPEIVI